MRQHPALLAMVPVIVVMRMMTMMMMTMAMTMMMMMMMMMSEASYYQRLLLDAIHSNCHQYFRACGYSKWHREGLKRTQQQTPPAEAQSGTALASWRWW